MIHKDHPRYESLKFRAKIVDAFKNGILTDSGMIAHGRGEAFDYLLGEVSTDNAVKAVETAAAALILADHPVISVNGNTTALVSDEIVELADILNAPIEINLFYRTPERVTKIETLFRKKGAKTIYGTNHEENASIKGLEGPRAASSINGIYKADVVLVPLEDGDRAEALVKMGKLLITIDLNPLSRTAKTSTITIVDNIVRAVPNLIEAIKKYADTNPSTLHQMIQEFDNQANIQEAVEMISKKHTGEV